MAILENMYVCHSIFVTNIKIFYQIILLLYSNIFILSFLSIKNIVYIKSWNCHIFSPAPEISHSICLPISIYICSTYFFFIFSQFIACSSLRSISRFRTWRFWPQTTRVVRNFAQMFVRQVFRAVLVCVCTLVSMYMAVVFQLNFQFGWPLQLFQLEISSLSAYRTFFASQFN